MSKRSFYASLENLHDMLDFIKDQAKKNGADLANMNKIELASEEALVNIVRYSYPEQRGLISIVCEDTPSQRDHFRVLIEDQGIPYNPLACLRAPASKTSAEPVVGGYGIFLMLQMVDQVDYERHHNKNELTLTKYY
jgi:serine/threonine-protein kinase RsbW